MKTKPNIILIVICTLIVLAGAYWFFNAKKDNDAPLTVVAQSSIAQARFQSLVSQLSSIQGFDTSIFKDPRFMGLVDLTTPIAPEVAGRIDPFAPFGVGLRPSTTTTATSSNPRP